jgi:hypothetical protein
MNARLTKTVLSFALLASIAGTAAAAGDHDHKPTRGGVVASGKEADYELVAKPTLLQLYVGDHGKPRDVSKASAKVTLLSGTEKQEFELKPAGSDRLEATGTFKVGAGTKVVAVVTDGGRTLGTARFTLK